MSHKLDSSIAVIGIDIGKNSFHVVGHDKRGDHANNLDGGAAAEKTDHRIQRLLRACRESGHAAALPSSVMNSRRFTARGLPWFRLKE
jgi:hypothetical protein